MSPITREGRGVDARDAEVGDLDAAVVVDEDVGGLQVAVDHALPVRVGEPVEHLADDLPGVLEAVLRHLLEVVRERLAVHQLHHDAGEVLGLDEVVDRGDARVREAPDGLAPRGGSG